MKICFITSTLETTGGVQRVLTILANALADQHEITILCEEVQHREKIQYGLHSGIAIGSFKTDERFSLNCLLGKVVRKIDDTRGIGNTAVQKFGAYPPAVRSRCRAFFAANPQDVIIGVQGRYALLLSLIADQTAAICIGWYHNSYQAYFETKGHYYYFQKKAYQEQMRKLDACVALTKKDCAIFNREIAPNFTWIYNPLTIDAPQISSLKTGNVLFVGRIVYEQKGIDYLLQIAARVKKIRSDFHLIVVGGGEDRNRLLADIAAQGLNGTVEYAGETNDVGKYYLNADVVVNTSRWEGFGLVLTEAMAYGVPVISFATEGPLEIIDHGENGYLVDNYDVDQYAQTLARILSDGALRTRMGECARLKAEKFKVQDAAAQWNALIRELTEQRENHEIR